MEGEGERSNATRVPKIHIVKKLGIRKRVQVFRIFILCQWIIRLVTQLISGASLPFRGEPTTACCEAEVSAGMS